MVNNPRVLIVADDLTGAMDSAGPFAGIGVETWVVAAPMQCDPATIARARVVSVNTDSRHLPLAPLQQVFAEARPGLGVAIAGAANDFSGGSNIRIWIADGATDADLAATVGTVQGRLGELLLAGSAGITKPLARACFGAAVSQ